jgi:hypothetical protein
LDVVLAAPVDLPFKLLQILKVPLVCCRESRRTT